MGGLLLTDLAAVVACRYGSPVQAGPAAASSAPAAASTAKAAVEMYDPTQPTTTSYVQPSGTCVAVF